MGRKNKEAVALVDFLLHKGDKLLPSGRDWRLDSDHSVTLRGKEWYDHEIEKDGGSISFVRRFYGLIFPEAVTMLLNGEQGLGYKQSERKTKEPTKPFALPPSNPNMRRVTASIGRLRHISISRYRTVRLVQFEFCPCTMFAEVDMVSVKNYRYKRNIHCLLV